MRPHPGHAVVVGFTDPPGVGKLALINTCIAELRKRGKSVGVVAVDPSGPIRLLKKTGPDAVSRT
ncbi:MAG: hypothetical protein H5U19_05145 [Rhodobacteraceae bacterium]|nr:hypothetical protein [Paracoccaceae bacterium]